MTGLEMPRKGVPPTSLGSSSFFISARSPFTSPAAIFVLALERKTFFNSFSRNLAVPSRDFSMTFPVKPSATSTSAPPSMASPASRLPTKFSRPASPAAVSRAWVSWRSLSPFSASAPMFSRATRGRSTPMTRLA